MALRRGAHAICEKPLVLNPRNLDALEKMEKESGKKIFNVLQLRLHESIIELKRKVDGAPKNKKFDIDLTYLTSRGRWYYASWKGNKAKSGGIATNIGVHFYDMLSWIFGNPQENIVHVQTHDRASGYLEFERARVRWFSSVIMMFYPMKSKKKTKEHTGLLKSKEKNWSLVPDLLTYIQKFTKKSFPEMGLVFMTQEKPLK